MAEQGNNKICSSKTEINCSKEKEINNKTNDNSEDTISIKIRIAAYFDGTGNNKFNTDLRRLYEEDNSINQGIKTLELDVDTAQRAFDAKRKEIDQHIENKSLVLDDAHKFSDIGKKLKKQVEQLESEKKNNYEISNKIKSGEGKVDYVDEQKTKKLFNAKKEDWKNDDFGHSFYNAYSNVAYLHRDNSAVEGYCNFGDLKDKDKEQVQIFEKFYIEGIGTSFGEDDDIPGGAIGSGPRGVNSRAKDGKNEVIKIVRAIIEKVHKNHEKRVTISELKIDIFGFSRGAAAARHFANLLLKDNTDWILFPIFFKSRPPILEIFSSKKSEKFDGVISAINFGFAGLFDTVSSVALMAVLGERDNFWWLNLKMPKPPFIGFLHLCALDEFRKNFPLTLAKTWGVGEYLIPGAHADIGGSYEDIEAEDKPISSVITWKVDLKSPPTKSDYEDNPGKKEAENHLKWLKDEGWIPNEYDENCCAHIKADFSIESIHNKDYTTFIGVYRYQVFLKRKLVKKGYSHISLKIMRDAAGKTALKFDEKSDTKIPDELADIAGDIEEKYPSNKIKFSSENSSLLREHTYDMTKLKKVKPDYFHFSSMNYTAFGIEAFKSKLDSSKQLVRMVHIDE